MKEWRVETPNDAKALKKTLDQLTGEGWAIEWVMATPSGPVGLPGLASVRRQFTVVASREAEA